MEVLGKTQLQSIHTIYQVVAEIWGHAFHTFVDDHF